MLSELEIVGTMVYKLSRLLISQNLTVLILYIDTIYKLQYHNNMT